MSAVTGSAVTLDWDAAPSDGSSDVAQYYIDLKDEQDFEYSTVGRVDGRVNSFTAEFLRKGRVYRFRVRAKNSAGFSEPPTEVPHPVELLKGPGLPLQNWVLHAMFYTSFWHIRV